MSSVKSESECFREAADRVWDLAKEYEAKGIKDLEEELKELATQLHSNARKLQEKGVKK